MYDVVIIGGGISGLYTAWRLGTTTNLKVVVLEADKRFGGRYLTCMLPGNFAADLGAMRFLPLSHKVLFHLVKELELQIEKFYDDKEVAKNFLLGYFRNQQIKDFEQLIKLYSIRKEDLPYFVPAGHEIDIKRPENGNIFEGTIGDAEQLAKDMTQGQYLSLSMNAEVINKGAGQFPLTISMADLEAWIQQFNCQDNTNGLAGYHCVKGGMATMVEKLLEKLRMLSGVTLLSNSMVEEVIEHENLFCVNVEGGKLETITGKSIVLACNARGIELISWNSPYRRTTHFQRLFSKLEKSLAVKVFLTYDSAWWEEFGLFCGCIETDLPIAQVTAFGQRGKKNGFATLLAAFTYKDTGVFEGLNQPRYRRFAPSVGDVPEELLPSQILVDYVQNQLGAVFGIKEMTTPVSAVTKLWLSDPIAAANYQSRVGVNTYELQWEAIKPFDNASIYIAGDTFAPCTKTGGLFLGWSEAALINSERILVNYFGLNPVCDSELLKTCSKTNC